MKTIIWNYNGALRKKMVALHSYDADVCIIQECGNQKESTCPDYMAWAPNYLWLGGNKNKGLSVFAKLEIAFTPLDLDAGTLERFTPCTLDGRLVL